MSSNIYCLMKVLDSGGNDVVGESKVRGKEGLIDVLGWEWGMKYPVAHAGAHAAGVATVSHLTVLKKLDRASPILLKHCDLHEQLTEVVLTQRRSQQAQQREVNTGIEDFYTIRLVEPFIVSVSRVVHEGMEDVLESLSFGFKRWSETNELHGIEHEVSAVRNPGGG